MAALINFALRQRMLVVIIFLMAMVGGTMAFIRLNIEAYPDPVPPLVDVVTQSPGMSAEEVERYITIPLETELASTRYLKVMRSVSLFGLSDVKLQFTYDYTYEEAEQKVLNKLSQVELPNGVQAGISPWSPIGEIYRYRLVGPPGYSVLDLKTLQDWVLNRRFKAIPGIIDVTGWGGKTKTYEINVDLNRLQAHSLTLPQVIEALKNSNVNVGGNTINIGTQSAVVRSVGLIHSTTDISNTVIAQVNGSPILVRDVADIAIGHAPRLGIAGNNDDDDIVQGIVLMRRGEESMPTIKRVQEEVARINDGNVLPPGVRIERIYDRQDLINTTTHTVLHNMVIGIMLIMLIQWLFLGNLRSAIICAATIPFALFFAVGIMVLRGESANLLSVGAIDFGLIVDATVIIVESIFRHLSHGSHVGQLHAAHASTTQETIAKGRARQLADKLALISHGAIEVNRSIFFSSIIIVAGFVPLFTMTGVEGHIFGPMAKTYAYALLGGLIATFTVAPALSALLLPDKVEEKDTFLVRWLDRIYHPALEFVLARRGAVLAATGALFVVTFMVVRLLGLEFLPKLEEGNLWIRATMPPTVSLEAANEYANRMRRIVASVPEVETVISQHGRPDDGTDAAGFFNAEFFAPLKPVDKWRPGVTKEQLMDQLLARLNDEFVGVEFNFSQYLQDNISEAVSGVKGENTIKVYGSDLATLTETANKIKSVLATVPGIADLSVYNSLGQPSVRIDINREKAARYGLTPGEINATIQASVGGQSGGNLYENGSDRFFPMMVRLAPAYRQNIEALGNITVAARRDDGGIYQVPLSEIATIKLVSGASYIYRERQERYLPIKFSVRDRDLGSAILEAQEKIGQQIALPTGYRLEWLGEFGNLQDAIRRLSVMVPLSFFLMGLLLYVNFSSLRDTLMAASVIPMAMVGGVFALLLTGTPFSVSAAIGFIVIFGIAVMDGILILSAFNKLIDSGMERMAAIQRACETQLRPVVMTCVVASVGLLPAAVSNGIGSQVQKPLALVVVGGISLTPVLILLIMPVLISLFSRRTSKFEAEHDSALAAQPAE